MSQSNRAQLPKDTIIAAIKKLCRKGAIRSVLQIFASMTKADLRFYAIHFKKYAYFYNHKLLQYISCIYTQEMPTHCCDYICKKPRNIETILSLKLSHLQVIRAACENGNTHYAKIVNGVNKSRYFNAVMYNLYCGNHVYIRDAFLSKWHNRINLGYVLDMAWDYKREIGLLSLIYNDGATFSTMQYKIKQTLYCGTHEDIPMLEWLIQYGVINSSHHKFINKRLTALLRERGHVILNKHV